MKKEPVVFTEFVNFSYFYFKKEFKASCEIY